MKSVEKIIRARFYGPAVEDMVAIATYELTRGLSPDQAIGAARHWLRDWNREVGRALGSYTYEEIYKARIDWAVGLVHRPQQPDEIAMEAEEGPLRRLKARLLLIYAATLPTHILAQRTSKSPWVCRRWKREARAFLATC